MIALVAAWMLLGSLGVAVLGAYGHVVLAIIAFVVVLVGTIWAQEELI